MNGINAWLTNASVGTSLALAALLACSDAALEHEQEAAGTSPPVEYATVGDAALNGPRADAATASPSPDGATSDAATDGGMGAAACTGLGVTDCIAACNQDLDCIVRCADGVGPDIDPSDCMP